MMDGNPSNNTPITKPFKDMIISAKKFIILATNNARTIGESVIVKNRGCPSLDHLKAM